jgi:hypothetical protein
MSQIFRESLPTEVDAHVPTEVDAHVPRAEVHACFDHLHAFNFGRTVQRIENARDAFWVRLRWLLLGAAVGVTLAAVYLQVFLSNRILQFTR